MKKNIIILAMAVSFVAISCEEKITSNQHITQDTITSEAINKKDAEKLTKVREALADFPSAKAEWVNGGLVISGNVSPTQEKKIKEVIENLNIGDYTNNLVVK